MSLHGKTALITGASRGIGQAIATELASEGANLILIARSRDRLQNLSDSLKKEFPLCEVHFFETDVSDHVSIKNLFGELLQLKLSFDILVNNAGIMIDGMLMMMKLQDMQSLFNVNVFGTLLMSQSATKVLIKKKAGSIINLTSIVGVNGSSGQSIYSASKSSIIGFTKSLSKELAPFNIRVNAIAPGFIDTDLTANLSAKVKEATLSNIGLKRFGKPSDVAKIVLFLASDSSSYITGQVIGVDGGMVV